MGEEILNLSTIAEHATINIASSKHKGGKLYELANRDDLTLVAHAQLMHHAGEVDRLNGQKEKSKAKRLTPKQERARVAALDRVVKILVPSLEPSVLAELIDAKKELIIQVWSVRNAQDQEGDEGTPPPRRNRTSAASSRRSRPSTAAARRTGS